MVVVVAVAAATIVVRTGSRWVGLIPLVFLVAALLWRFGPPIRTFVENNLPMLAAVFFALLFGGFLFVRFVL